jgi:hypothetical protein
LIPTVVVVLGKPYAVEVVKKKGSDYGECFVDLCSIEIASYQCDHQKRDTLLHEVMHAVDHEMDTDMKEEQIRRMATGLLAVLRQNPALVAFLTADNG